MNLERALNKVNSMRESEEVMLTLEALKLGKRFHATISFDSDTGLKEMISQVSDYNSVMKDIPLNELMAATDIHSIRLALSNIFTAVRKIRSTKYPAKRAMDFFAAISSDTCAQMIKVLRPKRLMHVPISELDDVMKSCNAVFIFWDEEADKMQQSFREMAKKQKTDIKFNMRITLRHKLLETRFEELFKFRKQHEQLSNVIMRVLRFSGGIALDSGGASSPDKQVQKAYDDVKEIDYLDISKEGISVWEAALNRYREQISRTETQLAVKLREQLGGAKNADEMFAIFSRFNVLFVRPHIRSAIREFQTQLIERVKTDIEELQVQYFDEKTIETARRFTDMMDIPEVSARIMWLKQIESLLKMNMKRVEDVLGDQWANHLEGKELKKASDILMKKLDPNPIFEEWSQKVLSKNTNMSSSKLFMVEKQQRDGKVICKLKVNYAPESIVIAKEVRNLKTMGFRMPFKIMSNAHACSTTYPYAISLLESIRVYDSTNEIVFSRGKAVELLVSGYRKTIHELLYEGYNSVWDNYRIESYVGKMAEVMNMYQEKVGDLVEILDDIEVELSALDKCQYSAAAVSQILQSIQKAVDQLVLNNYSNLKNYLQNLDSTVEQKLARRVEEAIHIWTKELNCKRDDLDEERESNISPSIAKIRLDIRILTQLITVSPSLDKAKHLLLSQFYAWHGVVTEQHRITSNRYQLQQSGDAQTYRDVLNKLPHKQEVLNEAYKVVKTVMDGVAGYVKQWTQYQSLWDLQPEMLQERLGDNLSMWMNILVELKKARGLVDTQDTTHELFPFVVDYSKVQTKVSVKYDYWQREVLQKLGSVLGLAMQKFFADISGWRSNLESQSIDSSNTSDTVALITFVQSLKKQTTACQEQVDSFVAGQKLLTHNRFQFPKNWLYAENVEGEWSALLDVLKRKDVSIQSQIANLQSRILNEDKVLDKQIGEIMNDWNKSKPVHGTHRPKEAIHLLTSFEDKFTKVKEDLENVVKAKAALEISDTVNMAGGQAINRLDIAFEELHDLTGVWKALLPIYDSVDEMKDQAWLSIQPRKLRQGLDEQLNRLKQLPSQYRSYESYEYAKQLLQNYSKMNMLVIELKSEALKERHWKQLMKELNVNWVLSDLTLGQVWDADLAKHESVIRQVLIVAQGELALEEFMKQVKDYWSNFVIELVNYQQKTKLIRGWDDLFNKLKEHMNSLAAMKLSPYYKQFEEDAAAWEERLNKINSLFDVWIDVQRRWVYLEGLFTGSADIAYLLPTESSRFNIVSTEFLGMMKKVQASPRIIEVVNIQGAQRILERLADMLAKIQKALGEYLERERSSFPRFYFVGDEDLLEILGNSKDIVRVQKHLKKMFAGIMGIEYDEATKIISAIASREGESVSLVNQINLNDTPKINDWLRALEEEMQKTLAKLLVNAFTEFSKFDLSSLDAKIYLEWMDKYPAQIVGISSDIWWSTALDNALSKGENASKVLNLVEASLSLLSDSVLRDQPALRRKKIESLITEFVHKRDVSRELLDMNVTSNMDFNWLKVMRYYFNPSESDVRRSCVIRMANAQFYYGFEYLGIQEKLVQTPLTDRCYLTMTQALHSRLGGSPFGPAGTGKTESVKALGHHLGRFVLVFNCDETFDFQAIGRILVGLCQVGAWGCFDEFNRLEERMLSAVSQQIQTIQESVKAGGDMKVDLVGKTLSVNANMAIFITMNPGYSGRSNLPDNLKQLFRSLAMTQPDRKLIAEVMLFSQGFQTAEKLAKKIVPLFTLCKEQLSNQCHYDFGLRALKYVLVSAGNIKRAEIQHTSDEKEQEKGVANEQQILIQSVCETLVPKLVSEDIMLLHSLLQDVFPDVKYAPKQVEKLKQEIVKVADQLLLCHSDVPGERGHLWLEKVLQLYQITNLNHGLMLVGASGAGKTMAWKVLLKALEQLEGVEGVSHIIDAKAMSKDSLYGVLDPNTREWTDGLFTHVIRKIIDNVRGEADKRQWIIFDGDVDPEWVENLNSVLDDNKLLTLPNGERLSIPSNVRIIFEVSDLKYATLATVSRCGMVWFSEDVVTTEMLFDNYLASLAAVPLSSEFSAGIIPSGAGGDRPSRPMELQKQCSQFLASHLAADGLVPAALEYALQNVEHVMVPSRDRLLMAFFSMSNFSVKQLVEYDLAHTDFPLSSEQVENYITKSMLINLIWSFAGDGKWKCRKLLSDFVRKTTAIALPPNESLPIIDYSVSIVGGWEPWVSRVPQMEIEAHRVAAADVVVPTMDTVRHELLLNTWLSERKPLVLCGPPGSGKTMTLLSALRSLPDMDVINVNFSSSTSPELLMRNFDHYCEYRRTPNGIVLAPVQLTRWLVIFCDEINLPSPDKYGTQRVISFMRQLVEQNGFYRNTDKAWITLERIQFVGACNPPTDPGRNPLSTRFLRHIPVVYVDYPGRTSLIQIYGTFNRAMLRPVTLLRGMADSVTEAMVEFYLQSQERFTQDDQPHYVYSPRELTRWVRGISEAISPLDSVSAEALVRLWAHEALRLFHDRLVHEEERKWTDELVDSIAQRFFGSACDLREALKRPMLYSCWLTKDYLPVSHEELHNYVQARLKGFYEEELDVKLVLFDQMLDHVLRIDRIYRQPQGHLLLIGVSGSGKTTLSRFVAWLNGLSVFQLKVHSKYTGADFDEDIRHVLRRAGCKNEKICFIMDESNMLDTGFLERLNTLLANGEVPGLFEGDEFSTLMNQIKEGAQRQGLMLDSTDELYKWFTAQVVRNLHVVFTMNPSGDGLRERASTSPALFNRCVLNWFGGWSNSALYQVGVELTGQLDMSKGDYVPPAALEHVCELLPTQVKYHHAVVNTFVHMHNTVGRINDAELRKGHRVMALSPRHFLDFIKHYINLFKEKREELEEEKIHLNIGLNKIRETQEQVKELQVSLKQKGAELSEKKEAANAKLKQMLADQQEAEKEKLLSENLQKELKVQLVEIAETKKKVGTELAQVEPTVDEAKNAVKGIKKTQLVELRSMNAPPNAVKLALESICLLMGEDVGTDWKAIRAVIIKDDFISRILLFDTDKVSAETKAAMEVYEGNPDWEFEKANRASLACGPLVKWMKAQLAYSRILSKVDPLRRELLQLENDAKAKTQKGQELKHLIAKFEESIAAYKEEYAQLIGQSETIKADLATVEQKVDRSIQLLNSLRVENDRWQKGCDGFSHQMETLIGDVLLSSAFLAYSGYYDQHLRELLFQKWIDQLHSAQIVFRSDLARIEYLSTADDRLEWVNNGMPKDDLCMENVIALHRFNRYPLIIDPSGQSMDYLIKQYPNIQKTSFQDNSFRKNLESALRFGSTLLVQDVESYDPILNPVLNREVKRTGGRILITLGDQDIDFSPAFKIFLFTRDSSVEFPPDVCSRVTFVNFTITRGSLEMQCLNQVLRSERPDIDEKRNDLLKLQGEFAVRLRQLEKALLDALNKSKGKILDDNSVIATLEKLKNEAKEVETKAAETDQVMKEVDVVSQKYVRLAHACSLIYLTMHNLDEVHFLYNYSLEFLLDIFTTALKSPQLQDAQRDYDGRLVIIMNNLFQVAYARVSSGMLHADKALLALLLLRIFLKCGTNETGYEPLFDHLLLRSDLLLAGETAQGGGASKISHLGQAQFASLLNLARLSSFKDCVKRAESSGDLQSWYLSDKPEVNAPVLWDEGESNLTPIRRALNELLVIHALRPDRLLASVHLLVSAAFGNDFMEQDKVVNLHEIVEKEVPSKIPLLLCSATGYDASGRVEDLAVEMKREITSIAIGSSEGFNQADSALSSASKSGRWILLKNVHLAPSWLTQLEKKLHNLKPHPQFRLMLTAEIHPKLPISIIQASRVLVFEPSTGLKANLIRSLSSIPPTRFTQLPAERSRLYFLLCWFHAIVQERLRYRPLGWANSYEFSDADLRVALDTLDSAVDLVASKRSNVNPEKLPWNAMITLLSQCIYGGKIDNRFDQKLLDGFLQKLFTMKIFDSEYVLIDNVDGKATSLHVPDDTSRDKLLLWVNHIKSAQMPNWIGLPNNAEKVLLTLRGQDLLRNMLKMSDEELAYDETAEEKDKKAPSWMLVLSGHCQRWLQLLPEKLNRLRRTKDNIKDPLFRFFEREVNLGETLLSDVRTDLNDILAVCRGEQRQNNHIRSLTSSLNKGQVPSSWIRYTTPKTVTSIEWMTDFLSRIKQFAKLAASKNLRGEEIWLGGMFSPEAYITATRQLIAQSNGWSLEQLHMHVSVGAGASSPENFVVSGLRVIGAVCKAPNEINLTEEVHTDIDKVQLSWNRELKPKGSVPIPVYLYATRADFLFCLDFIPAKFDSSLLDERGVAIVLNNCL